MRTRTLTRVVVAAAVAVPLLAVGAAAPVAAEPAHVAAREALADSSAAVTAALAALTDAERRLPAAEHALRRAQRAAAAADARAAEARARLAHAVTAVAALDRAADEHGIRVDEARAEARTAARSLYTYGSVLEVRTAVAASPHDVAVWRRALRGHALSAQAVADRLSRLRGTQVALLRDRRPAAAAATRSQRQAAAAADAAREAAAAARAAQDVVELVREQRRQALASAEAERAADEAQYAALLAESDALARTLRPAPGPRDLETPAPGTLRWPTAGRLSSSFGWRIHPLYGTRRFHAGIDIAAPEGEPVAAAAAGRVLRAGWSGGYGLLVVVDHGGALTTAYAHLSRTLVRPGDVVAAGQTVGEVGSTGASTGNHLHFEVRVAGEPADPKGHLPG